MPKRVHHPQRQEEKFDNTVPTETGGRRSTETARKIDRETTKETEHGVKTDKETPTDAKWTDRETPTDIIWTDKETPTDTIWTDKETPTATDTIWTDKETPTDARWTDRETPTDARGNGIDK